MFVRWEKRAKSRSTHLGDSLVCKLVESYRQDGRPRQRTVAYLGAIRETMPINHRIVFHANVRHRLDEAGITGDERAAILDSIAARVPFADYDQWEGD